MNRNHFGDGKYIFFKKSITTHNSNSLRYAKNIRVYLEGAKYVQAGTAEFQRNMRVHVHKARTGLKIQIQLSNIWRFRSQKLTLYDVQAVSDSKKEDLNLCIHFASIPNQMLFTEYIIRFIVQFILVSTPPFEWNFQIKFGS